LIFQITQMQTTLVKEVPTILLQLSNIVITQYSLPQDKSTFQCDLTYLTCADIHEPPSVTSAKVNQCVPCDFFTYLVLKDNTNMIL
jgi:hypothetical protein